MANKLYEESYVQAIASAIRNKNGSTATYRISDMATAINAIPTGGGGGTIEALSVTANGTYTAPSGVDGYNPVVVNVPSGGGGESTVRGKDITFYDYDGSIVASYSESEFLALTEPPENPSHAGLTSQGWNWSLSDAQTYLTNHSGANLVIGQMYVTDDGKNRIHVRIKEGGRSLYLGIAVNGTVVVDWGDGSSTDTLTGTALATIVYKQHSYASCGDYVISLNVTIGKMAFLSESSTTKILCVSKSSSQNNNRSLLAGILKIEVGNNTTIGDYAFRHCTSIRTITLPSGLTSIGNNAFTNCYCLSFAVLPSGMTNVGGNLFSSCYGLGTISIPRGIETISTSMFSSAYGLTSIVVPDTVMSISSGAFNSCYGMPIFHFLSTTPPTLAASNTLDYSNIIYVPKGCADAYKAATNWSSVKSKIQEE